LAGYDDVVGKLPGSSGATVLHMIEHILPPEVASFASRGDCIPASLYPEEAAQMLGAVDSRLREFATARACTRLALVKLGLSPVPILRGAWREPIWPDGVVGSITHCQGYRAAAVARQSDIVTIGIDAEPDEPLPPGILEQVAVAQEIAWIATARSGVHWDRLLFSAKESVFKAWYPLARDWLGFEQAVVSFCPSERTFRVRVLIPTPMRFRPELFTGRFIMSDGLLLTAVVIKN
jgi:4'-phosphopantetheinyl transferase EntD